MVEHLLPFSGDTIAVQITMPTNGTGVKLSTLIAQGTIKTPAADLPTWLSILSSVVDGFGPAGSSLQSRALASRTAKVESAALASNINMGYDPTMLNSLSEATGNSFATPTSMKAAQRTFVMSATTPFSQLILCHVAGSAVIPGA